MSDARQSTTHGSSTSILDALAADPAARAQLEHHGQSVEGAFHSVMTGVKGAIEGLHETVQQAAIEAQHDGQMFGVDGAVYDPYHVPLGEMHGVMRAGAAADDSSHARVVYINGIWTDSATQRETMQHIAEATGAEVVGLHNATAAWNVADLAQCVEDKADFGRNLAVESLAHLIEESVRSGEPLNILAHSQGALCTSRAVEHAIRELRAEHMDESSIKDALTNVHIQTFGGAALTYPDGPQYYHHVNVGDPVPEMFGYRDMAFLEAHPLLNSFWERDTTATAEHFLSAEHPMFSHGLIPSLDFAELSARHSLDDMYVKHINQEMIQPERVELEVHAQLYHPSSPSHDPAYGHQHHTGDWTSPTTPSHYEPPSPFDHPGHYDIPSIPSDHSGSWSPGYPDATHHHQDHHVPDPHPFDDHGPGPGHDGPGIDQPGHDGSDFNHNGSDF